MDLPCETIYQIIIDYVEEGNLKALKQFKNVMKSHTIRSKFGNSLLHQAIVHQRHEIFDYLLKIGHPLDLINDEGETALVLALTALTNKYKYIDDYFVNKLIEKGADASVLFNSECLHLAIRRKLMHLAKLLIENGVDINEEDDDGCTPLHLSLESSEPDAVELATMLLDRGADTAIRDNFGYTPFDVMVLYSNEEMEELLFFYTFDPFTEYQVNGSLLLTLVERNPSLFLQMYKNIVEVELDDNLERCIEYVFTMEVKCLDVFVKNFPEVLAHLFSMKNLGCYLYGKITKPFLTNLYYLSKSELEQDLGYFFSNIKIDTLAAFTLCDRTIFMDLSATTELYCFMLSFGLQITEHDVQCVYQKFGYCELFKTMLHMDIAKDDRFRLLFYGHPADDAFPLLCYNFYVNIQWLLKTCRNVEVLLDYYNHPVLKERCLKSKDDRIVRQAKNMPTVPLLMELARNTFRKHFINTFRITTSRKFYTLLKALPISPVHEKIITLETKLYYDDNADE